MRTKNYSLTCPACKVTYPTVGAYMNHARYTACTDEDRFWARVNKSAANGCWEWTGYRQKFGHGYLGRGGKNGQQTYSLAHRYAWKLLGHPLKDEEMLLHRCDNPPCVNPAHLFIGDDAANCADKIAKGRIAWGEMVKRNKLTQAQAEQVLREYRYNSARNRSNAKELADRYGVKVGAITSIVSGRAWPYLDRDAIRATSTGNKP